jgi:hypothetical protein
VELESAAGGVQAVRPDERPGPRSRLEHPGQRTEEGSDKYTGTLRLQENHTKGSVVVPPVPVRYGWDSFTSDVDVDVLAERLAQANTLTLKAYGQILEQF